MDENDKSRLYTITDGIVWAHKGLRPSTLTE